MDERILATAFADAWIHVDRTEDPRFFVRIGGFTAAEAGAFLGDLQERARQGRYFCSRTYYTVLASRAV